MPILREVQSSNIHSLGYDPASHILTVRFIRKKPSEEPAPDDKVYHHRDVPAELGESLMAMDEGLGGAYAAKVRNKFPHEVVPA